LKAFGPDDDDELGNFDENPEDEHNQNELSEKLIPSL
jgi:hypothetical protein